MGYMPGAKGILYLTGAPTTGTDEVQTATFAGAPTSPYVLNVFGYQTAPIDWSAVNATLVTNLQNALNAVPGVGANTIVAAVGTAVAGVGTVTLTFSGANMAKRAQPTIGVITQPTPGTLAIAETTPGVDANPPAPRVGAIILNMTSGALQSNTGTTAVPVWT